MDALVDARDRELLTDKAAEPAGELGTRGGDVGRDGGGSTYGSADPASTSMTGGSTSTTTGSALLCPDGVRVRFRGPMGSPEALSDRELSMLRPRSDV